MRSVRFPPIKETLTDPTIYEYQKVLMKESFFFFFFKK